MASPVNDWQILKHSCHRKRFDLLGEHGLIKSNSLLCSLQQNVVSRIMTKTVLVLDKVSVCVDFPLIDELCYVRKSPRKKRCNKTSLVAQ